MISIYPDMNFHTNNNNEFLRNILSYTTTDKANVNSKTSSLPVMTEQQRYYPSNNAVLNHQINTTTFAHDMMTPVNLSIMDQQPSYQQYRPMYDTHQTPHSHHRFYSSPSSFSSSSFLGQHHHHHQGHAQGMSPLMSQPNTVTTPPPPPPPSRDMYFAPPPPPQFPMEYFSMNRRSSVNTTRSSSPQHYDSLSTRSSSPVNKRYSCRLCNKRFTRPSSLTTHIYSHTGEKPFKCPVEGCGRHFSVVSNLRRHAKIHGGNTNMSASSSSSTAYSTYSSSYSP